MTAGPAHLSGPGHLRGRTASRAASQLDRRAGWHDHAGTGEDGAITVLVLLLSGALLAMAGLVWDGGLAISARQRAADLAEQAARAGADDLNLDATRDATRTAGSTYGADRIDTSRAGLDACHYLAVAAPHAGCAVTVTGTSVTVTVTLHSPTALLGLIGVHSMTTHGRATAIGQVAVTSPSEGGGAP